MSISASLFGLCNTTASGRFYPVVLPQGATLPAAVYQKLFDSPSYSQHESSDLFHPVFQISVYGSTYAGARGLADSLSDVLSGYHSASKIYSAFIEDDKDDWESETGYYKAILQVAISHKE